MLSSTDVCLTGRPQVCCWFVERRSEALSCLSLVYFSLTQLVLVQALSAVVGPWGWRAALRCAAATCAAAAPLTAALLRSTPEGVGLLPDARGRVGEPAPPPPSHLVDAEACDAAKPPHPTDAQPGAKAVGVDACERDDIPLLVAEESHFVDDADASDCSHTHAPPPAAPPELPPAFTRQEALATPLFRSWAFYTFVYFVVVSGSDFFLGSIVAEAGTVNVATTVSLAGGVASGVGCVAVGVALSRKAATPNAALALSGLLISLYALLLPHCGTDAVARLAGVARGFADASAGVALPALHAAAFGRPHSGAIFSVNRMLGVVGSGVGPLFFGLSRDAFGSFSFPLLAVAPLPAVAAAVAVAMMRRADAAGLRRDGGKGGLEIRRESGGGQHGVRSEELLAVTGSGDGMRALA